MYRFDTPAFRADVLRRQSDMGISNRRIAARAGVSYGVVDRLVHERFNVQHIGNIYSLCDVLSLTPTDYLKKDR